jgi:hypothetical protein
MTSDTVQIVFPDHVGPAIGLLGIAIMVLFIVALIDLGQNSK